MITIAETQTAILHYGAIQWIIVSKGNVIY